MIYDKIEELWIVFLMIVNMRSFPQIIIVIKGIIKIIALMKDYLIRISFHWQLCVSVSHLEWVNNYG